MSEKVWKEDTDSYNSHCTASFCKEEESIRELHLCVSGFSPAGKYKSRPKLDVHRTETAHVTQSIARFL